jgi:hypothetical protein
MTRESEQPFLPIPTDYDACKSCIFVKRRADFFNQFREMKPILAQIVCEPVTIKSPRDISLVILSKPSGPTVLRKNFTKKHLKQRITCPEES